MASDATSLRPSAMWDEKSLHPKIETGYASTLDIDDEIVQKIITHSFTQGSAPPKVSYYNPKDLPFQHLPVEEKKFNKRRKTR